MDPTCFLPWPVVPTALVLIFAPTSAGASNLDDFSNNLATDIAPLVALFGEAVTKQYLSESTSLLDHYIFALAPIGIITAIVSAIRVCGGPSLRALIGRAQEGEGLVEAELQTSTSRDVSEVFNKGGITRVIGRAQILEIIHFPHSDPAKDRVELLSDYLNRCDKEADSEWEEVCGPSWHISVGLYLRKLLCKTKKPRYPHPVEEKVPAIKSKNITFAPTPNLSLNVGIVRRHRLVYYSVAMLGSMLQAGVLVMAPIICWHEQWTQEGKPTGLVALREIIATNPSPALFIVGTVSLGLGMFLCAAMIGQNTEQRFFRPKAGSHSSPSRLFWLQPQQVVGDQTFDAYVIGQDRNTCNQYISSVKRPHRHQAPLYTWIIVATTLIGYILQFVALRGMSAYVSVAQLGSTLLMSLLRGMMRMQRLSGEANRFSDTLDAVPGHELDWLAMELAFNSEYSTEQSPRPEFHWLPTHTAFPDRPIDNVEVGDAHPPSSRPGFKPFGVKLFQYRDILDSLMKSGRTGVSDSAPAMQWPQRLHRVLVASSAHLLDNHLDMVVKVSMAGSLSTGDSILNSQVPTRIDFIPTSAKPTHRLQVDLADQMTIQLDASLGLWLWSLKAIQAKLLRPQATKHIQPRLAHILQGGVVGFAPRYPGHLDMWLGSNRVPTTEYILKCRVFHLNSATLWIEEHPNCGVWIPLEHGLSATLQTVTRLFGWPNFTHTQSYHPDVAAAVTCRVHCVDGPRDIEPHCVLDILVSTSKALLRAAGSSKTWPLSSILTSSQAVVTESLVQPSFTSTLINNLASACTESGICSYDTAFTCFATSLAPILRYPSPSKLHCAISSPYTKLDLSTTDKMTGMLRLAIEHVASNRLSESKGLLVFISDSFRTVSSQQPVSDTFMGYVTFGYYCHATALLLSPAHVLDTIESFTNQMNTFSRDIRPSRGARDGVHFFAFYVDVFKQLLRDRCFTSSHLGCTDFKLDTLPWSPDETVIPRDITIEGHGCEEAFEGKLPALINNVFQQANGIIVFHGCVSVAKLRPFRAQSIYLLHHVQGCYLLRHMLGETSDQSWLSVAARANWCDVVCSLLENGVPVDSRGNEPTARTALHWAAEQGDLTMASMLVGYGASLTCTDAEGNNPIVCAYRKGRIEVVKLLIACTCQRGGKGAKHQLNQFMMLAIEEDDVDLMRHILDKDEISSNMEYSLNLESILSYAIGHSKKRAAQYLVKCPKVQVTESHVMEAVRVKNSMLAQELCAREDISPPTSNGWAERQATLWYVARWNLADVGNNFWDKIKEQSATEVMHDPQNMKATEMSPIRCALKYGHTEAILLMSTHLTEFRYYASWESSRRIDPRPLWVWLNWFDAIEGIAEAIKGRHFNTLEEFGKLAHSLALHLRKVADRDMVLTKVVIEAATITRGLIPHLRENIKVDDSRCENQNQCSTPTTVVEAQAGDLQFHSVDAAPSIWITQIVDAILRILPDLPTSPDLSSVLDELADHSARLWLKKRKPSPPYPHFLKAFVKHPAHKERFVDYWTDDRFDTVFDQARTGGSRDVLKLLLCLPIFPARRKKSGVLVRLIAERQANGKDDIQWVVDKMEKDDLWWDDNEILP